MAWDADRPREDPQERLAFLRWFVDEYGREPTRADFEGLVDDWRRLRSGTA